MGSFRNCAISTSIGIKQGIADRRRVDQEQPLGIGVDAVLQCEVHQDRPAQRVADQPFRGPRQCSVLVAEQEKEFLGEPHHPAP